MTRIGTVDFYPGTKETAYGSFQPECSVVKDTVASCSHSRSHEYYMASIKSAVCLASRYYFMIISKMISTRVSNAQKFLLDFIGCLSK